MTGDGGLRTPGPLGAWQLVQNGVFYIHAAIATLVIGLAGLPALRGGRAGANRVASRWIGYMLWAARLHMGVWCEVRGTPPTGDCIIAAKHQCFLDILAIAHATPRRNFIMKREVLRVPVMGWYAHKVGCIPIDRGRGRDAMKSISDQINARIAGDGLGQLIIYPEGTRTLPGQHVPYKHGVATIRGATDLPVVPVAVNTGLFWPRKGWGIRPGRAVVEFLPAIPPGALSRAFLSDLAVQIEGQSDRLMAEAGFTAPPPRPDQSRGAVAPDQAMSAQGDVQDGDVRHGDAQDRALLDGDVQDIGAQDIGVHSNTAIAAPHRGGDGPGQTGTGNSADHRNGAP